MSFVEPERSGSVGSPKEPRFLPYASLTQVITQERNIHRRILECRTLIKSFTREEIRNILQKNIGSKNMPKLSAMVEFLEIKRGRGASEEFIRNIILLSLVYGSRRSRKELAFADLVFQALYKTLSK